MNVHHWTIVIHISSSHDGLIPIVGSQGQPTGKQDEAVSNKGPIQGTAIPIVPCLENDSSEHTTNDDPREKITWWRWSGHTPLLTCLIVPVFSIRESTLCTQRRAPKRRWWAHKCPPRRSTSEIGQNKSPTHNREYWRRDEWIMSWMSKGARSVCICPSAWTMLQAM